MREREGGIEREGDRDRERKRGGGGVEREREEGRERWGGERICNDIGIRTRKIIKGVKQSNDKKEKRKSGEKKRKRKKHTRLSFCLKIAEISQIAQALIISSLYSLSQHV